MNSQTLQSFMIPGTNYGYTAANVDELGSFENTIATGVFDESGSTSSFKKEMEVCIKEIIKSLRMSPCADKLIYRHIQFDDQMREHHGFKPLIECKESDYEGIWNGGGQTALYNTCVNVLESTKDYAKQHAERRYTVNGIVYVVTDGVNYLTSSASKTKEDVKKSLEETIQSECLESMITILIGISSNQNILKELGELKDFIGFTQFIPIENANQKSLAQLANFISKSVVSQSQALGTGGPSQSQTF